MVWAGVEGIRRKLTLPAPGAAFPALPRSLDEALGALAACAPAREWFGTLLFDCYLDFKRAELAALDGLGPAEICARYAEVYECCSPPTSRRRCACCGPTGPAISC